MLAAQSNGWRVERDDQPLWVGRSFRRGTEHVVVWFTPKGRISSACRVFSVGFDQVDGGRNKAEAVLAWLESAPEASKETMVTLPREGVPCRCEAREEMHMHIADEVFALVLNPNVPRGTMYIGAPGLSGQLTVDESLANAWALSDTDFLAVVSPATATCPQCDAANLSDPCGKCGARMGEKS
jgi:hypothetical protein